MMKKYVISLLVLILLTSCYSNDDSTPDNSNSNCLNTSELVINTNQYNAITSNVDVTNIQLNGDCLVLRIIGSGCDATSWELNIKAEDAVSLSSPAQRNVALEFINSEICLAVLERDFVFDLTDLQVANANQVIINIANSSSGNNSINYTY